MSSLGLVDAHGMLYQISSNTVVSGPNSIGSRGNKEFWGTCGAGQGCTGPCDSPRADVDWTYTARPTVGRGTELTVSWKRLNHPGGFVRLAIAPFDQSDSWEAFNNNIVGGSCYERGCGATAADNKNFWGPLTGSGSDTCSTTITVPQNLADGKYTIQWMWHGGGIVFGQKDSAFGEFYGCTDFKIQGGSAPVSAAPTAVDFKGGDFIQPNADDCRFWKCDKVGMCTYGGRKPANAHDPIEANATLDPAFTNVGPQRGRPDWAGRVNHVPSNNGTAATTSATITTSPVATGSVSAPIPTSPSGNDDTGSGNGDVEDGTSTPSETSPTAPGSTSAHGGKKCMRKCRGHKCKAPTSSVI
ncbi:hypothetical protein IWQ60_006127 [Tieghemiomyces parasiticus]|uniref:Uncharacterized protein n=1 Tax=Tieghemiomyces parasiticus TaxID=78921 RepID=A0A9W8DXM3_9FUNG|nr:hypothetical protein IWQ60_006127 [Tieghemiomyces parasiticus]